MSSSSSPASPAAGASSSAARSSRPCASSSPISRPTPRSASMASSSSSSSSFDVSLSTAGSTVASVDAPTFISASPSASAGLTIFAARRGQQRSAGTPLCCSRGRHRLRRAGSCRGGRPARNATGRRRRAPERTRIEDRTVSLTFERPSAAEIAREGASDALPGARLRPSRGEGYRKNCRCALRPENAVARAHLLGFGEIHARNARIVHGRRTSQPPRRVSPTCATACGVHRGVGRPNLTRCRLWRGWIRGLGTGSIETLGLCLLLKANSERKGLVWCGSHSG